MFAILLAFSKLVQFLPLLSDVFIRSPVPSSISKHCESLVIGHLVLVSLRELGIYLNSHLDTSPSCKSLVAQTKPWQQ